ncbi:MAG: hypothetical protein ISS48_02310 [Candidatus Aenigmarchaeota archaeon]|nr:hypothetical protein [Candidatus Aenigmarchaeota archaeon]
MINLARVEYVNGAPLYIQIKEGLNLLVQPWIGLLADAFYQPTLSEKDILDLERRIRDYSDELKYQAERGCLYNTFSLTANPTVPDEISARVKAKFGDRARRLARATIDTPKEIILQLPETARRALWYTCSLCPHKNWKYFQKNSKTRYKINLMLQPLVFVK